MFSAELRCISSDCVSVFPIESRLYTCPRCSDLLDVVYSPNGDDIAALTGAWDHRRGSSERIDQSGVWRFRELLPPADDAAIVTMVEGNTQLLAARRSAEYAGLDQLSFKHLGFNPTGSFKDLGMTTGITRAGQLGARSVACASTGNTSASMAAYAARAGMKAFVFVPAGQISLGKLAQALDYGATVLQLDGDFDVAMSIVREVTTDSDVYLLNSVNPFRVEGQKTIAFELLQQLGWHVPDRIVVPGGNLGNSSAIAKGLKELFDLKIIDRLPRLTIIQAEGANPLARMWKSGAGRISPLAHAYTLATAIKIGSPVSWKKAIRGLQWCNGDVEDVTEQEIADSKAIIGRDGIGCEPASAVSLAGIRKMVAAGRIDPEEHVIAILTGHVLKDPDYTVKYHNGNLAAQPSLDQTIPLLPNYGNRLIQAPAEAGAIRNLLHDQT